LRAAGPSLAAVSLVCGWLWVAGCAGNEFVGVVADGGSPLDATGDASADATNDGAGQGSDAFAPADASDSASGDGPLPEAAPPRDAESDGGGDVDATPADPCSGSAIHALCDDFDEPTLHMSWVLDPSCTSPVLDSAASVSPPNSLLSQVTTTSTCSQLSDMLPRAPYVHCEADVRFDVPPTHGPLVFFALTYGASTLTSYQVALALDPSQTGKTGRLTETAVELDGGTPTSGIGFQFAAAALGGWTHVALEVDLTGQTASATFGANTGSYDLLYAPSFAAMTSVYVHVGISGPPATVRYDNVFCDLL
jgi:hypothetical protein